MKTGTHTDDVVCKINITADLDKTKDITEKEIAFAYEFGRTSFKKINFSGVRLLYGKLRFKKPFPITIENAEPFVEMYFSLAGCRRMTFTQSKERSYIPHGHHNLLYIPDTEFYIEPAINDEENITLQIQFTEEYFKRFMHISHPLFNPFMNDIENKQLSILSNVNLSITPEMYVVLDNIVHCEKEGIIKQLYLENNVLKLLQLQFEQYEASSIKQQKYIWVKEYDVEKLHLAKTLLEQNITNPYSLTELAKRAGLNDFKLKKGFKELFGNTVFGYLHEQRMLVAKRMLLDNKSVTEVSEYCGYTYVQSFITAFKKKYGTTPDKFKK